MYLLWTNWHRAWKNAGYCGSRNLYQSAGDIDERIFRMNSFLATSFDLVESTGGEVGGGRENWVWDHLLLWDQL